MFETIKDKIVRKCYEYENEIVNECEQETIKRLEWLKKEFSNTYKNTIFDEYGKIIVGIITEKIDQSQNLPIEKIEEELK